MSYKIRPLTFITRVLFFGELILCSFLYASEREEWRDKMLPISPQQYVCRYTSTPINIEQGLNDKRWEVAQWTSDFVDIQGPGKDKPRFRTRAKLLWDESYLYVAAELEEPHVWATMTNHDSVIFQDPDFEVFIDPDGDTHKYYEFEINALNTSWDLLLDKPYHDHGSPRNDWEIPGLKTAVHVNGTLNNPHDTDKSWTVGIAFPWKVLAEHARHSGAPTEGEQWKINFSRVEWQIAVNAGNYEKIKGEKEDNWVWSPQGVIDMHRPEMWGTVQFTRQPATESVAITPVPGKAARDLALEIYSAQRDFRNFHRRWATNLSELNIGPIKSASQVESPVIELNPDGYLCSVGFQDGNRHRFWSIRQDRLLKLDEKAPVETDLFVQKAGEKFGDAGRRAAWFLVDNMPARDRGALDSDFLMEDVSLALEARRKFPWAKAVPEAIFLNDVLPYASLDEPRDPWRAEFYRMASELVKDCKTSTEAAQAINREIFKKIKVHYNTGRRRTNQSPRESIEQGKATCTGLSIILVDACRAVGVPARVAGVPSWADKEGNHTWVEIWDGNWYFTGADEYDKNGLNRGWFNGDAAKTARSTNAIHQIYATSWRRTGQHFPVAWNRNSREIPGINVSARYAALAPDANSTAPVVHVRLIDRPDGERVAAQAELRSSSGSILARDRTRAGTADLNDMPSFTIPTDDPDATLRFIFAGESREKPLSTTSCANSHTLTLVWSELTPVPASVLKAEAWLSKPPAERSHPPDFALSASEERRVVAMLWADVKKSREASAKEELEAKKISIGGDTLVWLEKTFGNATDGKHSLWITLHGGGTAPPEVNDRNWKGYYGRYEFPPGSINVAPRAPANSWNMWSVSSVDGLFDRLIADMVEQRGVDPNRVYLIGYSAGGDGVYQLGPRMGDRLAAATMCAGHPNSASAEPLRNLPFFLYMGGNDSAYGRNKVVYEFNAKLDALKAADPEGYNHRITVYPGLEHNMQGREAETIPRMAALDRDAWPKRVVWRQEGNSALSRFYWLARASENPLSDTCAARVEGQTISIEKPSSGSLVLRLSDKLLDLDQPVRVVSAGRTLYEGKVPRSFGAIVQSLSEREDPVMIASALLPVSW